VRHGSQAEVFHPVPLCPLGPAWPKRLGDEHRQNQLDLGVIAIG